MPKKLTPAQRLVVALDPKPVMGDGPQQMRDAVMRVADELRGTEVCLKLNSALRACGYGLIEEIVGRGMNVFADLKLNDIGNTLGNDGALLYKHGPYLLTAVCSTGPAALKALKAELPFTEVLGVTALTSLTEADTMKMFGCSPSEATLRFADVAFEAGIDGLITSPVEVQMLREKYGEKFTLNTPGIRPLWANVQNDDQNPGRIGTPAAAIKAGADRIIIGRPITGSDDYRAAVMRTLDEIDDAAG